ncbi:MAG: nicotinate phosphoribosyltransferase, partial [Pseudomonadota bacterium]
NTEAGFRYAIPVFGTAAHSWVMSFATERQACEQLQKLLGPAAVYLIDSYDTLEGARIAASLGRPLWGVRLDSGNLKELAPAVRRILDDAGLEDARIMATGDLNEYKILELVAAGVPIDAYGVGTDLATSADAPSLGVVYKMVEMEAGAAIRYTAKFSEDKHTIPGAKQIFRFAGHDQIALQSECPGCPSGADSAGGGAEALLHPVILGGRLLERLSSAQAAREHARQSLARLPGPCRSLFARENCYRVEYSRDLLALQARVRGGLRGVPA